MYRHRTVASALLATLLSATVLASADAATAARSTPQPALGSTAHAKGKPFEVSAHVNRTAPLVDTVVKVKGSVFPAAPGAKVTVQVKHADDTKWKTLGRVTLSAASKFKFKDKVTTVRERKYRVVKPGNRLHPSGHATTEKVTVYGWRDLTSLSPVITSSFYEVGSVTVNGVGYPDSLSTSGPATAFSTDYNLNRKCTAIEGRYGVADSSPVGSSATLSLAVDGVQKYTGTFGLTQSALSATDVTGAFRVTLGGTTTGATAVVASPRVLCSF